MTQLIAFTEVSRGKPTRHVYGNRFNSSNTREAATNTNMTDGEYRIENSTNGQMLVLLWLAVLTV